jgi:hypothetical protein
MSEQLFDELGSGLDEAVARGDLPNPGAWLGGRGTRNDADSRGYVWALRTRLVDLGYLGDNIDNRSSSNTDKVFISAVRRFQRDVGEETLLLQDGWVGPKTWRILQCLVSFEDEQEPRSWGINVQLSESPAVARAAYLRLWVMGFFEDWKSSKLKRGVDATLENDLFRTAFDRFWDFAGCLHLRPDGAPTVAQLNEECLAVLFNHDGIVRALASAGHNTYSDFGEQVEAITRIELWLLGYDCIPGPPRMIKRRRPGPSPRWRHIPRLGVEIGRFWDDFPDLRDRAPHDRVSPSLFAALRELLDEPAPELGEPDQVVRMVNEVLPDESAKDAFLETFEHLASSIWDGAKRIAKLIWRMVSGLVSRVSNLVRNLARYIAREARQFFHIVVRAVDVVQGGIDYLRNTIFPRDLPSSVVIAHGADFDHYLVVDPGVAKVTDSAAFKTYHHLANCYQAGCVILGELVGMLNSVVRLATGALAGPLGWLRALLAIGRFRSSIKRVKEALEALEKNYTVTGKIPGAVMRTDVA